MTQLGTDSCSLRIVQIINTSSEHDGGPARNSYELNLALNNIPGVLSDLRTVKPIDSSSVVVAKLANRPDQFFGIDDRPPSSKSRYRDLVERLRISDVVMIHGYYLWWVPLLALVSRLNGTPVVLTPHGSLTKHQQQFSPMKKRLFDWTAGRALSRLVNGFITGSDVEAADLKEKFPHSRVYVGGAGTQLTSMTLDKQQYSVPLRLLSVSRIAAKKRIDLMIDAVTELSRRGIDANLTVCGAGDDDLIHQLTDQVRSLGVEHLVGFRGHVSGRAKDEQYMAADIFLLPSEDENFGIGLAEALAHGLPIIASDKVAAASGLSPTSGRIISAPTGASLADAVIEFTSKTTRSIAYQSALTDARNLFSWDAVARRHARAIQDVMSRTQGGS